MDPIENKPRMKLKAVEVKISRRFRGCTRRSHLRNGYLKYILLNGENRLAIGTGTGCVNIAEKKQSKKSFPGLSVILSAPYSTLNVGSLSSVRV